MKRNSKNLLTLLLAGALCAATIGGVATVASAEEAATVGAKYALTQVFTKKKKNGNIIYNSDTYPLYNCC